MSLTNKGLLSHTLCFHFHFNIFLFPFQRLVKNMEKHKLRIYNFRLFLFLKHITSTPSQAFLCMFIFLYATTSKSFFWYLDVIFKLQYILDRGLLEIFKRNHDKIARFTVYVIIPFTSLLACKLVYSFIFF